MATTFYFNDTTTAITGVATTGTRIVITNVIRPLRKTVTRHKPEIPGRTGSWDFGGGVERDYTITVDLMVIADASSNLTACGDAIDAALDGKGALIFSDSTATSHQAQIYSEISLSPEGNGNVGRATLVFECDA